MIESLVQFLQRSTGNFFDSSGSYESLMEDSEWRQEFDRIIEKSAEKPRLLVDFIRKGIPDEARGKAWCTILRAHEVPRHRRSFDREMMRIFGTLEPASIHPPTFGNTYHEYASPMRKPTTVCKLLCIISDIHPELDYVPLIPSIVSILVKRMKADDCLACMAAMIEGHAIPASKRHDWAYFPLHRRDHLVFERVLEDLLKTFAPKLSKHIQKLQLLSTTTEGGLDWRRLLYGLFVDILPSDLVLRIFDSYLVEGYKIILRFAIAHLLLRQEFLLTANSVSDINEIIATPVESTDIIEDYFMEAIRVKFDRSIVRRYRLRRRKHSIDDLNELERRSIFDRSMPEIDKSCLLIREEEIRTIWSWVPGRMKLFNLQLQYSSAEHGRHILNVFERCQELEPLLMVLETQSRKVIGAFISKTLTPVNGTKFYGTGETFLFSLRPHPPTKYVWQPKSGNAAFICVTEQFMAFGIGDDFGLWIDKYLVDISSSATTTFGNPTLLDKANAADLQLRTLEIFRFI